MSVEQIQEAFRGLQYDALRRREYNAWLENFQRSIEAWQVTGTVLKNSETPRDLKIFCAQTLRNKVAFDLHQVPTESRVDLKDEIINILELINKDLLQVVGSHLCTALASLAMQIIEWKTPLQDIISRFSNTQMTPILFEFLKALPGEFQSKRAGLLNHMVVIDRSTQLIQNNAKFVMDFLVERADIMSQSTEKKIVFFETLNYWLPEFVLGDIIASPLVLWMLSAIGDEDVRPLAIDCLITVLKETKEVHEPIVQQAIKIIYPEILELFGNIQPMLKDDGDLHRELTRLISEGCNAWCFLIAKDPENFGSILEALILCVMIPNDNLNIVDITFSFFDKFRSMVGEPMPAMENKSYYADSRMRDPYKSLFLRLLSSLTNYLELPSQFDSTDNETAIRDFRYDVGDLIKVCGSVSGHYAALEWYCMRFHDLKKKGAPSQTVEALLFSCRAIARTIPIWEDYWMPQLCDQLFSLPHMDNESVQHAAIMLLGRYSEWIANHDQYLLATLSQLIRSSWSEYMSVRRASAHAFLYLCTDACTELCKYITDILEFYTSLSGKTELDSLISYSDGLGCIMNQLSDPDFTEAIQRVFKLVTNRINLILDGHAISKNEPLPSMDQIAYDIQGLGCIVGKIPVLTCSSDTESLHPLREIVVNHNTLFTKFLRDCGPQYPILMEGICRYYIRVLFNLAGSMQSDLYMLLDAISYCLEHVPHSAILYELSSVICQCYNAYMHTSTDVYEQVWSFMHKTSLNLFSSEFLQLIETDGGKDTETTLLHNIIFQGFHMLCDEAVYFPDQYLTTDLVPSIQLSAHIIKHCYDLDTLTAIGHFYDDIRSLTPSNLPKEGTKFYTPQITQAFEVSGSYLLEALFYFFMSKPDTYFELRAENLTDFLFRIVPEKAMTWLNKLMSDLPHGSTSEAEVNQCLEQITRNIVGSDARGVGLDLNRFIKAYSARNFDPRI